MTAIDTASAQEAVAVATKRRRERRTRPHVGKAAVAVWRVMRANPLTLVGFVLVVIIVVTAFLVWAVPALTGLFLQTPLSILPYPPNAQNAIGLTPPSLQHPLGTDSLGLDLLSRVLAALPLDLGIGLGIAAFALLGGGALGLVAGYWDRPRTAGGAFSVIILRITDVFLAFPSLVLALAIAASLGHSLSATVVAVMATWWPYYVRVTRGEVLAVKHLPYVTAARASGVSDLRILGRHIVRNILEPLTVYFTLDVGTVIVTFSTIAFIGITIPPSTPEWGEMISFYNQNVAIANAWWLIAAPGLAIFITVLAFSLLGDGLRDLLDPRSRRVLIQPSGVAAGSKAADAGAA